MAEPVGRAGRYRRSEAAGSGGLLATKDIRRDLAVTKILPGAAEEEQVVG